MKYAKIGNCHTLMQENNNFFLYMYKYNQGRPSGLKSGGAERGGEFRGILEPNSTTND